MPAGVKHSRKNHHMRSKYRRKPTEPRAKALKPVQNRDYTGKKIRSKGRFADIQGRLSRRLTIAKQERAKR